MLAIPGGNLIIACDSCPTLTMTMTPSIEEKTVMVIVSGHSRKILVVVEIGHFFDVGLEDLGRRTGLDYALELFRPSSSHQISMLAIPEGNLIIACDSCPT